MFVAFRIVLCASLALIQNRWITKLSQAERERLQKELQVDLSRLSHEFNNEIASACSALLPPSSRIEELGRERAYSLQYAQWKESHDRVFSRIALVVPERDGSIALSLLNLDTGQFVKADWPPDWSGMNQELIGHLSGRGPGGPMLSRDSTLIEIPRFADRPN